MSQKEQCLNCNETVSQHFCPNCGQKTNTHRITLEHFIKQDILHGVWHFEKGILFTLKEALLRPGKAALDYISGKRIRYYNVFYLTLLLIGLNILLLHFYDNFKTNSTLTPNDVDTTPNITKFLADNVKFILFCIVPILGCNSYLVFRRLKLNIAEHFIIGGMCLLGMVQLTILFSFSNFLNEQFSFKFLGIIEVISFFLIVLFPFWCYYNSIKNRYTFLGSLWRLVVFYILVLIQIQLILAIIVLTITNGDGSFIISL